METKTRSLVKSVFYRIYSGFIGYFILVLLTGSYFVAFKFGLVIESAKIFSYYLHERLWATFRFGMHHPVGKTIWFTGLSGSGKSTIAEELAGRLKKEGYPVQVLDGDKVRDNINKGLGFSPEDRKKNIFNIAHIAKLLNEAGVIVLVPVISPYKELRDLAQTVISDFVGVYVDCPLDECENRDPKGLYKKVRAGEIKNFTGISDPYEIPDDFEIVVNTQKSNLNDVVNQIIAQAKL